MRIIALLPNMTLLDNPASPATTAAEPLKCYCICAFSQAGLLVISHVPAITAACR